MSSRPRASLTIAVIASLTLLRILVSLHPHSGQDNYHGKVNAYGGDYEAQRHWMELTLHLTPGDWYWYDLEYWGLDYPPVTAYVSYICGILSSVLVGPDSMALEESRGYEDQVHKAYMRATVLVADLAIYFSMVWISTKTSKAHDEKSLWTVVLALSQPALILIDHGHFQYNAVSIGFALWACHYVTKASNNFFACIIGSIFFCLALNFKQMTLYYAPPIFFYLLGRCCAERSKFWERFCALGVTVVTTFVLLWWPFVWYGPTNMTTTATERLNHLLLRMFPFQRGLFEGKVSNLWCALSVKPISIRQRIPVQLQPVVAMIVTLLLILPACIKLFQVGKDRSKKNSDYDKRMLLWGMTSTGLAFFLASFQVHEKSILMALAPVSLLLWDDFVFVQWFSMASVWTLWPLMRVDRLETAYFCTIAIFLTLTWLHSEGQIEAQHLNSVSNRSMAMKFIIPLSTLVMIVLHAIELLVPAPSHLPDLYSVLWSLGGCAMFLVSWVVTCLHLHDGGTRARVNS